MTAILERNRATPFCEYPMNVILTDHGPVVIDWEGSRIGPRDADAAITWMLLEIGELDDVPWFLRPIVGLVRSQLLRAFLAGVPKPSAGDYQVCL